MADQSTGKREIPARGTNIGYLSAEYEHGTGIVNATGSISVDDHDNHSTPVSG